MKLPKLNFTLRINWIIFSYFMIISVLRAKIDWGLPLFWLGGMIGSHLLELDHLLYALWIYPHELTSMRVKKLFEERRFQEGLAMLRETRYERKKLSFHSVIFQAVLPIFAFFVLTSTGSLLGTGLVMALYLRTLQLQFNSFRKQGDIQGWFWQVQAEVSHRIQVLYFVGMLIFFILLSLFLI
jgi:hypothetical protein